MSNSTVYDIRLRYSMEGNAGKSVRALEGQLNKVGKASGGLGKNLKRLAAGAGAYLGFRAGAKHLIGFNSNMEQAKIQMAGMLQLAGKMDRVTASSGASRLVDTLQQKAKASVGTTQDMVEMASMITRPVMAAGMGMEKLADFTAQSVVAAKAFGIESGMAARDIESALMGQLRSVDRFSRALLEPLGYVGDEGRKAFNELGAAARAAKLGEALGGDAIQNMAQAQAGSFSGVLSTFQDTMQMTLGKVGQPLFAAVTEELKNWNTWIDANGKKVEGMAASLGSGLMSGFKMVKGVIGFMVDHADLLITVAKVWAGVKIGQKLGGIADSLGNAAGNLTRRAGGMMLAGGFDKAGLASAKFGVKLTAGVSKFAKFLPAIGAATAGLYGIYDAFVSIGDRSEQRAKGREAVKGLSVTTVKDFSKKKSTTDEKLAALAVRRGIRMAQQSLGLGGEKTSNSELALIQDLQGDMPALKEVYQRWAVQAEQTGLANNGNMSTGLFLDGKRNLAIGLTSGIVGQMGLERTPEGQDAYLAAFTQVSKTGEDLQGVLNSTGNVAEAWRRALEGNLMPKVMSDALAELEASKNPQTEAAKKPNFKVTINRIEVQSDDPDRFVVGLTETVRDAVRNRSAAHDTLPEGR